jgi:hypothetical protein
MIEFEIYMNIYKLAMQKNTNTYTYTQRDNRYN